MKHMISRFVVLGLLVILIALVTSNEVRSKGKQDFPTISPSESYVDFLGMVKLQAMDALIQIDKEAYEKSKNGEKILPPQTEFVMQYLLDTDAKVCPTCSADLQKILTVLFFNSKLAEEKKITFTLLLRSNETESFDFVASVLARVAYEHGGFQRGSFATSEELVSLLHRINFSYGSEILFSDLGFPDDVVTILEKNVGKVFPFVFIWGPASDTEFKERKIIYLGIHEKVNWSKLDQIITDNTPQ
ncbi:MAG: hypothetical protein WC460_01475 [Patescibacteria group bacterium]